MSPAEVRLEDEERIRSPSKTLTAVRKWSTTRFQAAWLRVHEDGSERACSPMSHQQLMKARHEVLRVQASRETQPGSRGPGGPPRLCSDPRYHRGDHCQMLRRVTIIDSARRKAAWLADRPRAWSSRQRTAEAEAGEPAAGPSAPTASKRAPLKPTTPWSRSRPETPARRPRAINCQSDKLNGSARSSAAIPRYRHQPLPQHRGAAQRGGYGRGRATIHRMRISTTPTAHRKLPSRWTTTLRDVVSKRRIARVACAMRFLRLPRRGG